MSKSSVSNNQHPTDNLGQKETSLLESLEPHQPHTERHLRELAEYLDVVFWSFDWQEQKVIYVSRAYETIWGRSVNDLYKDYNQWQESIYAEDIQVAQTSFERILETRGGEVREYRIVRPDGEVRWVSDRGFAIRNENGIVLRIIGIARDITEKKATEEALRLSEANYRNLFNEVPDAILITDIETREIVDANSAALELYGFAAEEILGMDAIILSAQPDLSSNHIKSVSKELTEHKSTSTQERLHLKKDGTIFPVEISSGPHTRDGRVMICAIIRDISERKQKEESLIKLQAQQQSLLDNILDITWLKDSNGHFIAVNNAFGKACGFTPEDLVGKTDFDAWPRKLAKQYRDDDAKVLASGVPKVIEEQLITENGERWFETIKTPINDSSGATIGTAGIARDMTERISAENEIQAEKERLAVTLRSIRDAVITTDRQGCITLMNPVAETLTGWKEVEAMHRPLLEVFHIINEQTREPCANPVEKVLSSGEIVDLAIHTMLIARDGNEYIIADSGAPITNTHGEIIGVVLVFRDITEQQRTEEELMKIEKLESLGVLAGGIAHDFNNFLTGIIGNLSLAKLVVEPKNPVSRSLEEMEKAAMRAKNLTQQLLTFSKGGKPVQKAASISEIVRESAQFALRGSRIGSKINISDDLQKAYVDESQISQVIHNLIINADQAMPLGGTVTVKATNMTLSDGNPYALKAGRYIMISIQDEGTGINPEYRKKVFDPYFSTKQKGSGLGLTVAHKVVSNHDGRLTVDSQLGYGTTFTILLPVATDEKNIKGPELQDLVVGNGRILIMDDEDYIRDLASAMLQEIGYDVTVAADGETAVEIYKAAQNDGKLFDAVILDLTIPGGMGGTQTLQQLKEINPQVQAIVSSGYSNDPVMADYSRYGFCNAIKKPYLIEEMSQALYTTLNRDK